MLKISFFSLKSYTHQRLEELNMNNKENLMRSYKNYSFYKNLDKHLSKDQRNKLRTTSNYTGQTDINSELVLNVCASHAEVCWRPQKTFEARLTSTFAFTWAWKYKKKNQSQTSTPWFVFIFKLQTHVSNWKQVHCTRESRTHSSQSHVCTNSKKKFFK